MDKVIDTLGLLAVIKEANRDIRFAGKEGRIKQQWDTVEFYRPYHERVKDLIPEFKNFIIICSLDFKCDILALHTDPNGKITQMYNGRKFINTRPN